jgi:hypothetical protein
MASFITFAYFLLGTQKPVLTQHNHLCLYETRHKQSVACTLAGLGPGLAFYIVFIVPKSFLVLLTFTRQVQLACTFADALGSNAVVRCPALVWPAREELANAEMARHQSGYVARHS